MGCGGALRGRCPATFVATTCRLWGWQGMRPEVRVPGRSYQRRRSSLVLVPRGRDVGPTLSLTRQPRGMGLTSSVPNCRGSADHCPQRSVGARMPWAPACRPRRERDHLRCVPLLSGRAAGHPGRGLAAGRAGRHRLRQLLPVGIAIRQRRVRRAHHRSAHRPSCTQAAAVADPASAPGVGTNVQELDTQSWNALEDSAARGPRVHDVNT